MRYPSKRDRLRERLAKQREAQRNGDFRVSTSKTRRALRSLKRLG